MTRKSTIILIDDVDGGTADETVTFVLDGTDHEIDLSTSNASVLRSLLAPYIAAGRKTNLTPGTAGNAPRKPGGGTGGRPDAGRIRRWATDNGYQMASRGPIPERILEAFHTAGT
jgi:hypothetical protein